MTLHRRLLCWLGLHEWKWHESNVSSDLDVWFCAHCGVWRKLGEHHSWGARWRKR
jgi:hypothetical protein